MSKQTKKNDNELKKINHNILLYFAIFLLAISLIVFSVNIIKIMRITGRATDTGEINLTVESKTQINFTTDEINWGSGSVSAGASNATLNTAGGANNVTNGNWTGNTAGLVVENIGNKNVTLDLKTGNNATALLGGTNPSYQYNVTNVEAGSCTNSTGGNNMSSGISLGNFYDVNTTDPGTRVCDVFAHTDSIDTIRIDIKLVIPSDSKTGKITDTITATATTI